MSSYFTLLFISFFVFSCSTKINYVGRSLSPSKKVDVYVDPSAIKRAYTIVGKGYIDFAGIRTEGNMEKVQEIAIKKAREKGVDAILFQDYYVTNDGNTIYSVTKTDSVGKG